MKPEERMAWLAERKQGIGGSEAAAILGLSPWQTPTTVWLDKTGRSAPKEETDAMWWGTELEETVARRYTLETGRQVQRYNKMIHQGCLLGNFDRLVIKEGEKVASHMGEIRTDLLLECKTANCAPWDEVPLYYQTQVQHYMGLAPELQHADVACLFYAGRRFGIYRVERDQETIDFMREKLTAWWEKHIVRDEMPAPTCELDCKLLWSRSTRGSTILVTDEIKAKLDAFQTAKAAEKAAQAEATAAQNDIETFMGDKEVIVDAMGIPLCTWKTPDKDRTSTDWEAIARELGATQEMISKHTTSEPGARRFLPKASKGKKDAA